MKKIVLLLAFLVVGCSSNEDEIITPEKEIEQVFTDVTINYTYYFQNDLKKYETGFVKFIANPCSIETSEIQKIGLTKYIGTNKFSYYKEWQGIVDSATILVFNDRIEITRNNIKKVYYKN